MSWAFAEQEKGALAARHCDRATPRYVESHRAVRFTGNEEAGVHRGQGNKAPAAVSTQHQANSAVKAPG